MTYHIKETRKFYGPKKSTEILTDYFGKPETFATREAAMVRIDALENGRYTLARNETARPTYRIVKARA